MVPYYPNGKGMKEQARTGFAREMARKIIKKYAVREPGTPLEAIARGERLTILYRKWPDSVSGLLLRSEKVIGVNANHHPNRQRFSIAHELGHYFLGHSLADYGTGITLDNPPTGDEDSSDAIQNREADEFANEILVPLPIAKETVKTVKDIKSLSEKFRVSKEVMFIALTKHKLI